MVGHGSFPALLMPSVFAALRRRRRATPSVPAGERVYAIGDVHGRLDLLVPLLESILADDAARANAATTVVFLGDVIDRGPDSAGIVDFLMAGLDWARLVCLRGNHEAAMLAALEGHSSSAAMWLRHGGMESLASWGVPHAVLDRGETIELLQAALDHIPPATLDWLSALPLSYTVGSYHFVHAGVRPGIALAQQTERDALWIRDDFLDSTDEHEAYIVHGHTVTDTIDERPNRLGLDTGAYLSGRLSAVGLEGTERWFLESTGSAPG